MNPTTKKIIEDFLMILKVSEKFSRKLLSKEVTHRLELSASCLSQMMISSTTALKLIPKDHANLDLSLISAAGRSMLELSNNCYFYGAELIPNQEQEFRKLIFDYNTTKERLKSAKRLNTTRTELEDWELTDEKLISLKGSICKHSLFIDLLLKNKFQGFDSLVSQENNKNKYYSRDILIKNRGMDGSLLGPLYSLQSSMLHHSPSGIKQHIDYLENSIDNSNPNFELNIAVSLMTFQFCLFAKSIEEINNTFDIGLYDDINVQESEIITDYSTRYNKD